MNNSISQELNFFLLLAKTQSMLTRRFDNNLGGLGFNEFMILFYLSQSKEEKMRRIDLAGKLGLTASGITRLLIPMEKIGWVKREPYTEDARVSFVSLAKGGKNKLADESMEDAENLAKDLLPPATKTKDLETFSLLLSTMSGTIG
ncbi:MAG: MarR family winged helix-turn-helix transcriptional regulator [Candidatus Roizmanbacteria bacterium]|nr:MarR family winged helix-turn-helix transcriptional regulator [Candidatus Roizmanbacteria bacterium]